MRNCMDTVKKTAYDPNTDREYEIELPADDLVEDALLELDYPADGLHKDAVAEKLAEKFSLTEEQINAKSKGKNPYRIFNYYVGIITGALIRSGKLERPKRSWVMKTTQGNNITEEIKDNSEELRDTSENSIEKNYQQLRENLVGDLVKKNKGQFTHLF